MKLNNTQTALSYLAITALVLLILYPVRFPAGSIRLQPPTEPALTTAIPTSIPTATPIPPTSTPVIYPTASPTLSLPTGTPIADPVMLLTDDELNMLYRQGYSECRGMGEGLPDCVKGVTTTIFARMVYDNKLAGEWYLSDGTIYGTFSAMSGDMPQFTPWNWDRYFCTNNPGHQFCRAEIDLTLYTAPVQAAIRGDGGTCAGYLFYGHEYPPDLDSACAVTGAQTMYFHNGWGWTKGLAAGEWIEWYNQE